MAINYTWNCKTVDVKTIDGNQDTVFNVHWRLTGTDDSNDDKNGNPLTATVYGTQVLNTSDLSNFINFEDLTNEIISSWVEESLGADKLSELETNISYEINELSKPTQETKTIGE